MSHAKQAPTKRKRSIKTVPVLGAAGLSLSLASGAAAATGGSVPDMRMRNTAVSHEITLCEEEISDVSLATLYVFDREGGATSPRGVRLAMGGCGGCGGCPCAGKRLGPPRYSIEPGREYAHAPKRRHVPK